MSFLRVYVQGFCCSTPSRLFDAPCDCACGVCVARAHVCMFLVRRRSGLHVHACGRSVLSCCSLFRLLSCCLGLSCLWVCKCITCIVITCIMLVLVLAFWLLSVLGLFPVVLRCCFFLSPLCSSVVFSVSLLVPLSLRASSSPTCIRVQLVRVRA